VGHGRIASASFSGYSNGTGREGTFTRSGNVYRRIKDSRNPPHEVTQRRAKIMREAPTETDGK
jgi:hypothetical protein